MRIVPALVAATCLAVPATTWAQLQTQVVPVRMALTAKPGEPVERDVVVSNSGDRPVVVRTRLSDLDVAQSGEIRLLPPGTMRASIQGLVTFEPAEFSLAPNQSAPIHITIAMPADGLATRWGVVLAEVRAAQPDPIALGPRAIVELGTTIYVSRVDASSIAPEVIGLDTRTLGHDSLGVVVRMRNQGERQYYVLGQLVLADSAGREIACGPLPGGVVLPGAVRDFAWAGPIAVPAGRYTVRAKIDTGEPELLVGEKELTWPAFVTPPLAGRREP